MVLKKVIKKSEGNYLSFYNLVYENGEIVPVPYAMGITWDMVSLASKYLD